MEAKTIIEIVAVAAIVIAVLGILIQRIRSKKGIGVRVIQFVAIVTIPCVTLILGLEGSLDGSAIAALLGGLAGYIFSNIGRFDESKSESSSSSQTP